MKTEFPKKSFTTMWINGDQHTLELRMPCLLWSIQQPIVERLVAEGNTAKLFTPVDIPRADAYPDLLGFRVFMVVLTHSQQYSWGSCKGEESWIRL